MPAFGNPTSPYYRYDTANHGIGRLAKITDVSGTTAWEYDQQGRITRKQQSIVFKNNGASRSLMTHYHYDGVGHLIETVYPSGVSVSYGYTNGDISSLKINGRASFNIAQTATLAHGRGQMVANSNALTTKTVNWSAKH